MAFQGYRAGRVAGGGLYNGYKTPKATQVWNEGDTVNVGFLKGLEVVEKIGSDYRLWNPANGKKYTFTPHQGIFSGWVA